MSDPLLKRTEIEPLVGLKRSAIYERISAGTFPKPVQLRGVRGVFWRRSTIDQWLEENLIC